MTTIQQLRKQVEHVIDGSTRFQHASRDASHTIAKLTRQGKTGRDITDALHGKQLGHPLHPVLTDITIGSWVLGVLFDAAAFVTRSDALRRAAQRLIVLGNLSAIPTAVAGLVDYSAIKQDAAGYGAAHGLLNGAAWFCFARSITARSRHQWGTSLFFSLLGLLVSMVSAWLGGDLVFHRRIGVNHADTGDSPEEWTAVLPDNQLEDAHPLRVTVDEVPILLVRYRGNLSAIGAVCSHAGGPLEQGKLDGYCIECPWHQSVFDVRDGQVVHAPSTYNQPRFQARVRDGQIEVRCWPGSG